MSAVQSRSPLETTVFFDGSCPLCRREIALYRNLKPLKPIQWLDVSGQLNEDLPSGKSRCELMARFHVCTDDGRLLQGAEAFVHIWNLMPGWRFLGKLARLPGALRVLEWAYNRFLSIRPKIQSAFRAMETPKIPNDMIADLRSDHVGELGAVWIYKGMLATARDPDVIAFAQEHLKAETLHLEEIKQILPRLRRSWTQPIWIVAGWLTGAIPGLAGRRWVFKTIEAVETFVDQHYEFQLIKLQGRSEFEPLAVALRKFQFDEQHHRDDASTRLMRLEDTSDGPLLKIWCKSISSGSVIAVALSKRI